MTVSMVAHQAGKVVTQIFQWKKAYSEGSLVAVGANKPVVPASEMVEALKRIKQLEGALGRKTL
jgi:transposase